MAGTAHGADSAPESGRTMMYRVKQLELAIRARLDELLRPAGITPLQYTVLTVLRRRASLSSAQLARNSFVTPQTMADMVTALEKRRLVERHADPADARRLRLSLTDMGYELLADYEGPVAELEESMLRALSPQGRAELGEVLDQCRAALADEPPQ
ncbi:MAG TPA: MarR family transcriptional regulator [Pseudonocardiaceae bacterium]|nr:MarR family transcriptional regulator [Pseudonocardiaceae bacterium]